MSSLSSNSAPPFLAYSFPSLDGNENLIVHITQFTGLSHKHKELLEGISTNNEQQSIALLNPTNIYSSNHLFFAIGKIARETNLDKDGILIKRNLNTSLLRNLSGSSNIETSLKTHGIDFSMTGPRAALKGVKGIAGSQIIGSLPLPNSFLFVSFNLEANETLKVINMIGEKTGNSEQPLYQIKSLTNTRMINKWLEDVECAEDITCKSYATRSSTVRKDHFIKLYKITPLERKMDIYESSLGNGGDEEDLLLEENVGSFIDVIESSVINRLATKDHVKI